jgi:hypothetical protein
MKVDIADANDLNQRYVSNLQERIIAQEASLAKSENVTKSKFICLPNDPSKGKNYTYHNGNWQGATYDDSNIDEEYLCKYNIRNSAMSLTTLVLC